MADLHTFGLHSGHIEEDLAVLHFVGPLQLPEGRQFMGLLEEVIAAYGHVYVLAHIDKAGTIAPEVRREIATWVKSHPILAMANIKGSPMARSLAVLLSNALRLFGVINYVSGFFDNEADARKWIAQLKRERQVRPSDHP